MKRLTDVRYWEAAWREGARASRLRLYRDFDYETVRLLRAAAGRGRAWVLEVGAGNSRVLPYLARAFGYVVCGTDFSPTGCQLLSANLSMQGVAGAVVREDLFQSSLRPETFDVVYSSGLIEHFDDTRAVSGEHVRLLKPGGRLVLIVPNLQGIQGAVIRRLAPPLWSKHRVFGPEDLAGHLRALGLESVRRGYLGSFLIHVGRTDEWTVVKRWPRFIQALIYWSVRLVNGGISFFFRLSPLRPHSRAMSPAFYAEGTKPREENIIHRG
jgi:2-polyprenyl-6-hydroxyphenyl methylase/3-demethylubiquinone-9 3-methyltransferase